MVHVMCFTGEGTCMLSIRDPCRLVRGTGTVVRAFAAFCLRSCGSVIDVELLLAVLNDVTFIMFKLVYLLVPGVILQGERAILPGRTGCLVLCTHIV